MITKPFGCAGGSGRDSRSNSAGSTSSDSAVGVATKPGAAVRQSSMPHCLPGRICQSSWSAEQCLVGNCRCQPFTGTLTFCHQSIHPVIHCIPYSLSLTVRPSLSYSLTHSVLCSCTSFISSFFISHTSVRSCIHSFIQTPHLFSHSFIHLSMHSFMHALVHS